MLNIKQKSIPQSLKDGLTGMTSRHKVSQTGIPLSPHMTDWRTQQAQTWIIWCIEQTTSIRIGRPQCKLLKWTTTQVSYLRLAIWPLSWITCTWAHQCSTPSASGSGHLHFLMVDAFAIFSNWLSINYSNWVWRMKLALFSTRVCNPFYSPHFGWLVIIVIFWLVELSFQLGCKLNY